MSALVAEFKRDGSELWVSSEIGGTVSVIDPAKHAVTGKITFEIPGLRRATSSARLLSRLCRAAPVLLHLSVRRR